MHKNVKMQRSYDIVKNFNIVSLVCEHEHLYHMLHYVVIYGNYFRTVRWAISLSDVFHTKHNINQHIITLFLISISQCI